MADSKWKGIEELARECLLRTPLRLIDYEKVLRERLEPLLEAAEDTCTLAAFLRYADEPAIEHLKEILATWR